MELPDLDAVLSEALFTKPMEGITEDMALAVHRAMDSLVAVCSEICASRLREFQHELLCTIVEARELLCGVDSPSPQWHCKLHEAGNWTTSDAQATGVSSLPRCRRTRAADESQDTACAAPHGPGCNAREGACAATPQSGGAASSLLWRRWPRAVKSSEKVGPILGTEDPSANWPRRVRALDASAASGVTFAAPDPSVGGTEIDGGCQHVCHRSAGACAAQGSPAQQEANAEAAESAEELASQLPAFLQLERPELLEAKVAAAELAKVLESVGPEAPPVQPERSAQLEAKVSAAAAESAEELASQTPPPRPLAQLERPELLEAKAAADELAEVLESLGPEVPPVQLERSARLEVDAAAAEPVEELATQTPPPPVQLERPEPLEAKVAAAELAEVLESQYQAKANTQQEPVVSLDAVEAQRVLEVPEALEQLTGLATGCKEASTQQESGELPDTAKAQEPAPGCNQVNTQQHPGGAFEEEEEEVAQLALDASEALAQPKAEPQQAPESVEALAQPSNEAETARHPAELRRVVGGEKEGTVKAPETAEALAQPSNKAELARPSAKLWRVVGGEKGGGVKVRMSQDRTSREKGKFPCGAIVQQIRIKEKEGRLLCRPVTGEGPLGWVSIRSQNRTLVERLDHKEQQDSETQEPREFELCGKALQQHKEKEPRELELREEAPQQHKEKEALQQDKENEPFRDIVPMGHYCITACLLKEAGWRRQALPVDWSAVTFRVWIEMLGDDFATLLTPRVENGQHPYSDNRDVLMFRHQGFWANDDVRRRVDRLRGILARRSAFGVAIYLQGEKNLSLTKEEVLADAREVLAMEPGFAHIAVVWIEQGEHKPPWLEEDRFSVLGYNPLRPVDYDTGLSQEDKERLQQLLHERFPLVFPLFEDAAASAASSERDAEEHWNDHFDDRLYQRDYQERLRRPELHGERDLAARRRFRPHSAHLGPMLAAGMATRRFSRSQGPRGSELDPARAGGVARPRQIQRSIGPRYHH